MSECEFFSHKTMCNFLFSLCESIYSFVKNKQSEEDHMIPILRGRICCGFRSFNAATGNTFVESIYLFDRSPFDIFAQQEMYIMASAKKSQSKLIFPRICWLCKLQSSKNKQSSSNVYIGITVK